MGTALRTVKTDGWANAYTGVGTSRDKMTMASYSEGGLLSAQQCSILFHNDDIARRIVTTRPEEMLRAGYQVQTDDQELTEELRKDAEALEVDRHLFEAMCWGKCFGGAALILGVKDGRPQQSPLDEKRVRSVDFLSVLDRRYIHRQFLLARNPSTGIGPEPWPDVYRVTSPLYGGMSDVHESRVIRFEGELTDVHIRIGLQGWSISTLQCAYEVLQLFGMSFASVGHLLQDASQGVFKMKDLMHMIANNREALMERMELVETSRSVARAILLDETEDFARVTTSFASLPELLDRIMQRMSAATKIPVTLLMGRSAAGMNATGDSDFRAFYDSVGADQRKVLLPALLKVYRLLAVARGADPEQIRIKFNKLWEPTEQEESLTEKQDADRDCAYIAAGVLLPEEVAMRISNGNRKISQTEIDIQAREASKKIELEMMADPEMHKPAAGEPGGDPLPAPGEKTPKDSEAP
jgi:phage-related protein (TIGR01555 family)